MGAVLQLCVSLIVLILIVCALLKMNDTTRGIAEVGGYIKDIFPRLDAIEIVLEELKPGALADARRKVESRNN